MDRLFCFSLLLTYLPATGKMSLFCIYQLYLYQSLAIIYSGISFFPDLCKHYFCSTIAAFSETFLDRRYWMLYLFFNLESMEGCLSQTNKMIWRKTGQSVFLKCSLSSICLARGLQFEWFAFKENVHLPLNVIKNPHKYSLDKASLNIKSLHTNESGIYYCAVFSGYKAPGTPYVALGTTLVVTGKCLILKVQMFECVDVDTLGLTTFLLLFSEHISPLVRHILLWLSFALLATYSLAIGTLILKKVSYWNTFICNVMYC